MTATTKPQKLFFSPIDQSIAQMGPQYSSYELEEKMSEILNSLFQEIQHSSGQNPLKSMLLLRNKLVEIVRSEPQCVELLNKFNEFVIQAAKTNDPKCLQLIFTKKVIHAAVSLFAVNPWAKKIVRYGELATVSDAKVMQLALAHSIPCKYEPEIRALVPNQNYFQKVQNLWRELREPIRIQISAINLIPITDSKLWTNSAKTKSEFLIDEQVAAKEFLEIATEVADLIGANAHFGLNNVNITKSEKSVQEKIERIKTDTGGNEEYAIGQIEDGVRGTLSFRTPEQLKKGVIAFATILQGKNWEVDFTNIWESEFDYSGYVDIDAKIRIPLPPTEQGLPRYIMAEIQFHLDDFYDGRPDCIVSRAHKVYEVIRMIPVQGKATVNLSFDELNEASRMFFTAALYQVEIRAV